MATKINMDYPTTSKPVYGIIDESRKFVDLNSLKLEIANREAGDLYLSENKQDKLTAGENVTISSNVINAVDTKYIAGQNITISDDNIISSTCTGTLQAELTTNITVGGVPAGTTFLAGTRLEDIIKQMLCVGPITTVDIYHGALDEAPTSIEDLTKESVHPSVLVGDYEILIVAGNPVTEMGQYVSFAVPDTYTVEKWIAKGFKMDIPHTLVHDDGYNIYYLDNPSYDEPNGIEYIITVKGSMK